MSALRAAVIVCSTRAAAGEYVDTTGPHIVATVKTWGLEVNDPVIVPDGPAVKHALVAALADGVDLILTSGGTGISPTDVTPECTQEVLDCELPGLADGIRAAGVRAGVPTAMLSRGSAGVARSQSPSARTLIVNLPGSRGGVKDGLAVVAEVAHHALDQLAGGDHARPVDA